MELVTINNTNYGFVKDFKHNAALRSSFNALTEATFDFNFEKWYTQGYWGDNYVPYSLVHHNKVVSNVSVSSIKFVIEKEKKVGLQIGTVMTDTEYRHRGLNKFILNRVLNDWKDKADFIYLFANDSVLNFYPKFNFEAIEQYQHSKQISSKNTATSVLRKLNIEDAYDREVLLEIVNNARPISKISMQNNTSLLMFYWTSFKKDSIYYLEKRNTVVIMDVEGDTVHLHDVFSIVDVALKDIIESIAQSTTKKVVLGFTPFDETGYDKSIIKNEDTLFVFKDNAQYFKNKQWMFPVLSHA